MTGNVDLANTGQEECLSSISSIDKSVNFRNRYYVYEHTPLHTCEEYSKFGPNIPENINCCMPTKNLFLVDRKKHFFLITASADTNFDMKIIIVLVLYYNLIINMIDCGLKVIIALGLLMGPKEVSCYIWAMVFPIANCFRFFATPSISIIRLISILVKRYQLECSKNWKLVAIAFLACLVAVMVAILPVQTIQGIGLLHKVNF